jgi:hypothetical protein
MLERGVNCAEERGDDESLGGLGGNHAEGSSYSKAKAKAGEALGVLTVVWKRRRGLETRRVRPHGRRDAARRDIAMWSCAVVETRSS